MRIRKKPTIVLEFLTLTPTLRIALIPSPVCLLSSSAFFLELFFHAPQLTSSYTHRFHSALILTAFVMDIAITCCTVQRILVMNYMFHLTLLSRIFNPL
ncbi:uncharacterized protein BJ212DRAFT_1363218 [Suillus subaureus]|uniref:Uncharacterized protein n=1 Tax=Suillus subaureus TaxID=48587 RepID=A0A9P7E9G8_9AGAM|nr:uncharacterized protein BJ212DRAFT_1363218 [Suillus subaureus]KAG1814349.1 hypothetical protein BJ212DRAFT_1363218 [Suillus subaureus]